MDVLNALSTFNIVISLVTIVLVIYLIRNLKPKEYAYKPLNLDVRNLDLKGTRGNIIGERKSPTIISDEAAFRIETNERTASNR